LLSEVQTAGTSAVVPVDSAACRAGIGRASRFPFEQWRADGIDTLLVMTVILLLSFGAPIVRLRSIGQPV
ncbi:MAG: hypothetical protein JJ992_02310, partial [Planctomycetes bacterium]|nr:hypothetical protein [Planctomycetota bacterium]